MRHFALHVLEFSLKKKWNNNFSDKTKETMKNCLLDLVANKCRDIAAEKTFIKQKLAKLVAGVAQREFPQRWTNFQDQMLQLWSMGDTQSELTMMILRSLAEDCSSSDFNAALPSTRRKEILQVDMI